VKGVHFEHFEHILKLASILDSVNNSEHLSAFIAVNDGRWWKLFIKSDTGVKCKQWSKFW